MASTARLVLWKGYQSPYTLGLSTSTAADPQPTSINLLAGNFALSDSSGASNWIPTIAAPKEGLWADSQSQDGRQLLVKPMSNAIEELTLVCSNRADAYSALTALNRFGQAARDYWAGTGVDPVYVEWAATGGKGSQWALIYSLEAAAVEFEPVKDDATYESITLSVTFEREIAWRGVPFGVSPKVWAMAGYRGLQPTTTNPAPAGFYGYDNLDLGSGSGDYAPIATKTIRRGDELGTSNTNYIDVDSTLIAGDAPALCQVTLDASGMNVSDLLTEVFFAASRKYDYFPANNSAGSLANSRARMSFNCGDATTGGDATNTVTKTIVADGYLSNGSIANRYVGQCAFAASTTAGVAASFSWAVRAAQLEGRYAVFMRHTLSSGTATAISAQFQFGTSGSISTSFVTLDTTIAGRRGGLLYLGDIIIPNGYRGAVDGTGANTGNNNVFSLHFAKTGGGTHTLLVWEVVLLPLSCAAINAPIATAQSLVWYDSSGYLQTGIITGSVGTPVYGMPIGQDIELTPNTDNRIYCLLGSGGTVLDVTSNMTLSVDVVPRWYGVRDA